MSREEDNRLSWLLQDSSDSENPTSEEEEEEEGEHVCIGQESIGTWDEGDTSNWLLTSQLFSSTAHSIFSIPNKYSGIVYNGPFRFPVDSTLNKKIALSYLNLSIVNLHALVVPVLKDGSPATLAAGLVLKDEGHWMDRIINNPEKRNSLELMIGHSFVIKTVSLLPRYLVCVVVQSHLPLDALSSTLWSALQISQSHCLHTIAILPMGNQLGHVHDMIKTIRNYLSANPSSFDLLVISPSKRDWSLYKTITSAYFPRTLKEEVGADLILSNREREVKEDIMHGVCIQTDGAISKLNQSSLDPSTLNQSDHFINVHNITTSGLTNCSESIPSDTRVANDKKCAKRLQRYRSAMERAIAERADSLSSLRLVYCGGPLPDTNWNVAVIVGCRAPTRRIPLHRLLLHLIQVMDPLVNQGYVIVYFHTLVTKDNKIDFCWFKTLRDLVDARYTNNLQKFIMVHAPALTRLSAWWGATRLDSSVTRKLIHVKSLAELATHVPLEEIDIPDFITEYDMKMKESGDTTQGDTNKTSDVLEVIDKKPYQIRHALSSSDSLDLDQEKEEGNEKGWGDIQLVTLKDTSQGLSTGGGGL